MTSNASTLTLDELPEEGQILVDNARQVAAFFHEYIEPKLSDSLEEIEQFRSNSFQYLIDAGCPVISQFSEEQKNSFNEILGQQIPDTENIGCWICTKAIETVISVVVAVGLAVTVIAINALAVAFGTYTGGVSIVLILIVDAGIAVGVYLLAPMVEALATSVCKKMGSC